MANLDVTREDLAEQIKFNRLLSSQINRLEKEVAELRQMEDLQSWKNYSLASHNAYYEKSFDKSKDRRYEILDGTIELKHRIDPFVTAIGKYVTSKIFVC